MTYQDLKLAQENELNEFTSKYCFWAFGQDQLNKKLAELGITEEELQEKYVGFYGGAMRADKVSEYEELLTRHFNQLQQHLKDTDFALSAFKYELANHEYGYTYDETPALRALGLSARDVADNEVLRNAFVKAVKYIKEQDC